MDLDWYIERQADPAATIITMPKRLDGSKVARLRALITLQEVQGSLILNLARVTFIDSMGIALLVSLQKESANAGKRLILCEMQWQVFKVVQLCQLEPYFVIISTQDKALQSLQSPSG